MGPVVHGEPYGRSISALGLGLGLGMALSLSLSLSHSFSLDLPGLPGLCRLSFESLICGGGGNACVSAIISNQGEVPGTEKGRGKRKSMSRAGEEPVEFCSG